MQQRDRESHFVRRGQASNFKLGSNSVVVPVVLFFSQVLLNRRHRVITEALSIP
jgi:hypothetical protein